MDINIIIDQLAILDLTGTDLIECMYAYTERINEKCKSK
jgi:hypothetical protein